MTKALRETTTPWGQHSKKIKLEIIDNIEEDKKHWKKWGDKMQIKVRYFKLEEIK